MTTTVLMRETRISGNGTFHEAGSQYTLDDGLAQLYLSHGWATYVSGSEGSLVPANLRVVDGNVTGLEGPDRIRKLPVPRSNDVLLFGDSFQARSTDSNTPPRWQDYGLLPWLSYFTSGKIRLIRNAGVSGNTSAQIRARLRTDVLPYISDGTIVIGNAGINSASAGVTAASIIDDIEYIIGTMRGVGAKVIWSTISPYTAVAGTNNVTVEVNAWLREYCSTLPDVYLIDLWGIMVDPTSTSGAIATNYSGDNLHPSAMCAREWASAIADVLEPMLTPIGDSICSAADCVANNANSTQLLPNPLFSTTGGTGTIDNGTGTVSGTAGDAWTVKAESAAITIVASVASRSDGCGNDQILTSSGASATARSAAISNSVHTLLSPGDTVYGQVAVDVTGMTGVTGMSVYLDITSNGTQYLLMAIQTMGTAFDNTDLTGGIFRTPEFTIPSGGAVTNAQMKIRVHHGAGGESVMKVGRAEFRIKQV